MISAAALKPGTFNSLELQVVEPFPVLNDWRKRPTKMFIAESFNNTLDCCKPLCGDSSHPAVAGDAQEHLYTPRALGSACRHLLQNCSQSKPGLHLEGKVSS